MRSAQGETVPVGGPRARALLAQLALNAGRIVGVEQLIADQYGDEPPDRAINAVQAQVSRLRRSLSAELIEFHRHGYRLAVTPEDVDAFRFEQLARAGHGLLVAGQPAAAATALREGLGLWRGAVDLPPGSAQAVRLTELRLAATEDLVDAELALPGGTDVAELRALVAANPLRERLRGQLMRALQAAGSPAAALAEFDQARRVLADEFGADPSPELAAVHLAVLRAERPALRGLPGQLSSFVGRDGELARLAELRDARLVTVVGPGGIGKTRLVIEAAGRGGQPVCFVDLSLLEPSGSSGSSLPVSGSPEVSAAGPGGAGAPAERQVAQAVLGALGLRESGFQPAGPDPIRRLVAALTEDDPRLVLDNCEHVVAAAAALVRTLLAECPRLRIVATSREPLGLTGEALVPLAPLDARTDAVRLFTDRAAAVNRGIGADPRVAEICASLDGLPLAIELAAARLRQFSLAEIAARLTEQDRFRLLSRGDRTAAARHRTLHAVVEWSWDLLGPDEQRLARRLAVFTGGAPLTAIEAICEVPDAEERLTDLMDKSLVLLVDGRYRMLETIRLFCADKLIEAGEHGSTRRAHASYHLALAQRADPHLRRSEQLEWIAVLAAEHGNLTAALGWAAQDDRPTAFRLVAALAAYWWLSGRQSGVGEIASELLGGDLPAGLDEEYVSCVVHAFPRPAPAHWTRAERILRTVDRPLRHPFGVAFWGMAAGPPDEVTPSEWEGFLGGDPWSLALGRLSQALLWVLDGRVVEGERELLAVLVEFRAVGERWGTAQALDWLALAAGWRGEWSRAHALWTEALTLLAQLGALEESVDMLCRRAECLLRSGDQAAAAADYRLAAERCATAGRPATPPAVLLGLAEIARHQGDAAEAGRLLSRALEATVLTTGATSNRAIELTTGATSNSVVAADGAFGTVALRGRVLTALARLAQAADDDAAALRWYREALAVARSSPLASDLADAAESRAGAALLLGDPERAALLLGAAVALRTTVRSGDVDVAGVANRARESLGQAAFAATYARAAAMTRAQALAVLGEPLTG